MSVLPTGDHRNHGWWNQRTTASQPTLWWCSPPFDHPGKAGPAHRWTRQKESWPWPSWESYSSFLHTALGRDGPTPHYRIGRTGPDRMGRGELVLLLPWFGAAPVTWSDQLNYCPGPQLGLLGWRTLTSTLSRTCWSSWRDCSCGEMPTGSPGPGMASVYLRGVRWGSTDDAVPETRGSLQWTCERQVLHKRTYCVTHQDSQCH